MHYWPGNPTAEMWWKSTTLLMRFYQLQVLRRLSNTLATHTKLTLFRCYVLSNFTFCSTIFAI